MNYLQKLAKARRRHTEAQIAHSQAKESLEEYELKFVPKGGNADERKHNLKVMKRQDDTWQHLKKVLGEYEFEKMRAETEVKILEDERRYGSDTTYAKSADYLIGKVDRIDHAPEQVVWETIKKEIKADILKELLHAT